MCRGNDSTIIIGRRYRKQHDAVNQVLMDLAFFSTILQAFRAY
jgi:hypothetical protein